MKQKLNSRSKKIIFFTSSNFGGGAEKQLVKYFQILNINNNCEFYTAKGESRDFIKSFQRKKTVFSFFDLLKKLYQIKPDFLITTLPTPNLINTLIKKTNLISFQSVVRIANNNVGFKTSKFIVNNSDKVIFNSIENLDLYSNKFPNKVNNFFYVNNAIDYETIPKYIKKNKDKNIKALVVSRLTYNKGLDILIDCMNELVEEKLYIDIYGIGPDFNKLKTQSRNNKVKFVNRFQELENLWKNYDLYILPSRKEGMSNSLLEAQLHNLFSIVSDCETGNKEVIKLTNNGVLFENENYIDLKNKILNFVNNKYSTKESSFHIINNFSRENTKETLLKALGIQN